MDDIAFISLDAETTQRVLSKLSRISATLGFRANNTKTEISKRAHETQVSGFEVYTRAQPPSDGEWHSNGSKLVVQPVFAYAHGGPRAAWLSHAAESSSLRASMAHNPPTGQN